MGISLYKDANHQCWVFADLVKGIGIQANQFLIINNQQAAILDPGGQLTYHPLLTSILKHVSMEDLRYVIASHQDPDIIASLGMWLNFSKADVVSSKLWTRFLPHLISDVQQQKNVTNMEERMIAVPDRGTNLPLGSSFIKLVPAHFLHSVGNFQIYDPISKILFSGDMGASISDEEYAPVEDFDAHISSMEKFHMRYMVSNKVCRLWVNMIRKMDIDMIVPQHGKPFHGNEMIGHFLDWIEGLQCGIDLLTERDYRVPD